MFARTPRLLLRPGWSDDSAQLVAALNDEGVARNLSRVPFPYGPADAEQFLAMPQDQRHPNLLIFSRTSGLPRLVGGVGLARGLTDDTQDRVELGYWIARPYWGLGFATEAARALMQAVRAIGHRQVMARHAVDNPASGRVLRKLGFRPTGATVRTPSRARGAEMLAALFEDGAEGDMGGGKVGRRALCAG